MDVRCSNCQKRLGGRPRCGFCGAENPTLTTGSRNATRSSSGKTRLVAWLAIVIGLVVVMAVAFVFTTPMPRKAPPAISFGGLTAAEHLSRARSALNSASTDVIEDGIENLNAIPINATESYEARNLLPKLRRAQSLARASQLITDAANGKNAIYNLRQAVNTELQPLLKLDESDKDASQLMTRALGVLAATMMNNPQDRSTLITECENAVLKNLKAPATAHFAWAGDQKVDDRGSWRYAISSYVDAENSFGAKIRTEYKCELTCVDIGRCDVDSLSLR